MARTGRRPGPTKTREAILVAARASFAQRGYQATTIRGVAREAGVDPALVGHYFGPKSDLFAATLELPHAPTEALDTALVGDPDRVGERVAGAFVDLWDSVEGAPLMSLLRSAASSEQGAAMMREFAEGEILPRLASVAAEPDRQRRATLAMSQLLGLALARYVVRVDPLALAPRDELVSLVGPTLQRYLRGAPGEAVHS